MKVRLTPRALSEAKRIKTWWRKNRPAAPGLFDDEMAVALEQIRTMPTAATIYPASFEKTVYRLLMPKTQNHIYYAVRDNAIVVLSVWGAPRRRGPKL
jgi:plasmid stabilization system protein ParE